jgi:hypothetical protein
MTARILFIRDYEHRSRNPDAVHRDPAEPCVIVVLPVIRIERFDYYDPAFGQIVSTTVFLDNVWR